MNIQTAAYTQLEVYEDGVNYIGLAKVTLPDIAQKTVTLSGAGMSGDQNVPIYGMTENMVLTLEFASATSSVVQLLKPVAHNLDLRVCEQLWNVEVANHLFYADKFLFLALPRLLKPGDIAPFSTANASMEFDVVVYSAMHAGKVLWRIDKRNMIFEVDGFDYMREVRIALGKGY